MDINYLKDLLQRENLTLVAWADGKIFKSRQRGIGTLFELYDSGNYRGVYAADKVVGKGAAFLYAAMGADKLYCHVVSESALEILERNGISTVYKTKVPYIINRSGDGICPMESAVNDINDTERAIEVLRRKHKELVMGNVFENAKKNLGFGFMRLPMVGKEVDIEQTKKMVDTFMANGFNYFDTAHGYLEGRSELALKECLTSRYKRDDYILTNKLSDWFYKTQEEIRPLFEKQLEACGVEYFDFYLLHSQNRSNFEKNKKCRAYETVFDLKAEGKVKHVGISFHDKADVLDMILSEYPQIEVVQIQFNYADYEDASIESRKCYDVCVKHAKPVIVMEPVRGGHLVKLPAEAGKVFDDLKGGSYASYAIRFAAGFENVKMVLSGMSNMEQLEDNISYMKDFKPLTETELEAVEKVCKIFKGQDLIPCTACEYCVAECPKNIAIPNLFGDRNAKKVYNDWSSGSYYKLHTTGNGKPSDCIQCGCCETVCPQKLPIRKLLKEVGELFETKSE